MSEPLHVGHTCALILAGGNSSRMGQDKVKMTLDGQTLTERAAGFWRTCPGIESVIIAAGREEHFETLPHDTVGVYDFYPGCGPLAGIHAAFVQTDAQILYVSAADMPRLDRNALLPIPKGDAAVGTKNGRPEPLFAVYRRSALPVIEDHLRTGQRRLTALLDALDTAYYPLSAESGSVLDNLNTPEDWLRTAAGSPPMIVFAGWSGSGKTTFIEKLLPELTGRGLKIAVLKHDGHGFQMDKPGKDTYRFAAAGSSYTGIIGPDRWALLGTGEISLQELRQKLPPVDLIIAEGFKFCELPKIEVHRRATGKPFVTRDHTLLAAVTDEPLDTGRPELGLEDIKACADLLCETFLSN